jgi:hypothetical protein
MALSANHTVELQLDQLLQALAHRLRDQFPAGDASFSR